jgi:hypothetical protein
MLCLARTGTRFTVFIEVSAMINLVVYSCHLITQYHFFPSYPNIGSYLISGRVVSLPGSGTVIMVNAIKCASFTRIYFLH